MSDDLRIALLGSLVVTRGGHVIPDSMWRSRQERRLLGILLTARGAHMPIERLIEWLWPDTAPDAAAITLRSAISGLRHTLEPGSGARASSRYILTQPGGYAWNVASGAWLDVDEFLALTTEDGGWRMEDGESRIDPPSSRLERAIALYHGDYLADEPAAPWAAALREALRERFLAAIHDLAELRLSAGEYDAAIDLARRGLARDRLREPLYRTLMRTQARAGDVAGALRSYERYRRTLDEELGAAPSAQTQALHTAILRAEVTDDRRPTTLVRTTHDARRTTQHASPFVGRAAELAVLRGWIAELERRRGGMVALVGEAGIGKTRLADEALRAAAAGGALVIALRCTMLERELPFAPLSEALRPLLRAAPEALLRRLPPAALAQAADLLPALRERLPDLPALLDVPPPERRNRLLDGLVGIALALARDGPLVISCDDAQWADEATLAALGRLARHAPRQALLLILAYRAEDLAENPALHALLRELGREMLLRPLLLNRFDADEVTQFLAELAQTPPAQVARLAQRLMASSGGNPLFLGVAVQALLESRSAPSLAALLTRLATDAPLPDLAGTPRIRDLVLARLERLPAPTRALLEQIAVIGRPVSLDLIEQLAGTPGLHAAQTLLERHFLVEGADGRLRFGHDLVRSIIAAAISSPQRRLLHRQAADAIAALHGDRPERSTELAFHFGQAGHGADSALLRYATIAGDQTRGAFGYHAALGHYDAALRAAERLGAHAPQAEVRRAFAGRLHTCEALLDWDGIIETAARYERWAAGRTDAPPLVPPRRLVLLRALMGDLAGAAALSAEQAQRREAAPAIHDMLWRTAIILQPIEPFAQKIEDGGGRIEDSGQHLSFTLYPPFMPAHPLPGAPADDLPALLGPEDAALALFQVGWAALMQGLLCDAEPCLRRAYTLAGETGQAAAAVVAALQLAHLHALRGERDSTARWLETSLDLASRAPEAAWASIWPRIHQGFLLLLADQHAAAQERFEEMAARLEDLPGFQSHRASVEAGLGLLALARGDGEHASAWLNHALLSPQLLYGFVYVAARHGLARIAAMRGDMPAARAILAHALDYSAHRSLLPEYIRTAIEITRVERDFGDPAPALPLLRTAAGLASGAGLGPLAAAASTLLARLLA